ncbi:MAG: hypothetical protein J7623_26150 [Chitinophaga sp.]|uniref:hypothetical protein n=1 Tax=Chitinophaga sp. TaxID=1869181 RepID=UPI001B24AB49|nr:hypothetical protein [Chitinophaga sp.]MBO9732151.1 hypothetical protein [Chitinophaga sp.]
MKRRFLLAGMITAMIAASCSKSKDQEATPVDPEPTGPFLNKVTKVFEYSPAPGQFINTLPAWNTGDDDKKMAAYALDALSKENMISLGGFGGYVVMGFDHTIKNVPGQYSFVVLGNAFTNFAEPGVISVSVDKNKNGLPDDEWFEIAGSEYNSSKTIKNYQITYYKPDETKAPVIDPDDAYSSNKNYIKWKDNQGDSGYLVKNVFHDQSYYPQWKGNSITFIGTKLTAANVKNTSSDPGSPYYVSLPFSWGYSDNVSNDDPDAKIKIDWAVDKNGNSVKLTGINFIKVQTGQRAEAGWLGEISTEVLGVKDLNLK